MLRILRNVLRRLPRRKEERDFFEPWGPPERDAPPNGPRLALTSDEIELVCDALWFLRGKRELTPDERALWDRLQPIRHGDYGGTRSTVLTPGESGLVARALDIAGDEVPHDPDEAALRERLRG